MRRTPNTPVGFLELGRMTKFSRLTPGAPREAAYDATTNTLTWKPPADASNVTHYLIYADYETNLVRVVHAPQTTLQDSLIASERVFISSYNYPARLESPKVSVDGPIAPPVPARGAQVYNAQYGDVRNGTSYSGFDVPAVNSYVRGDTIFLVNSPGYTRLVCLSDTPPNDQDLISTYYAHFVDGVRCWVPWLWWDEAQGYWNDSGFWEDKYYSQGGGQISIGYAYTADPPEDRGGIYAGVGATDDVVTYPPETSVVDTPFDITSTYPDILVIQTLLQLSAPITGARVFLHLRELATERMLTLGVDENWFISTDYWSDLFTLNSNLAITPSPVKSSNNLIWFRITIQYNGADTTRTIRLAWSHNGIDFITLTPTSGSYINIRADLPGGDFVPDKAGFGIRTADAAYTSGAINAYYRVLSFETFTYTPSFSSGVGTINGLP